MPIWRRTKLLTPILPYLDRFRAAVQNRRLLLSPAPWPSQTPHDIGDQWGAARYCIDLLLREPGLRRRFPRALSDGGDGAFARWLIDGGDGSPPLGADARHWLSRTFAEQPAESVRNVFSVRGDLRARSPLGLMPAGLPGLFRWLFEIGTTEHQLRPEAILWFALQSLESPADNLVLTYQLTPEWQRAVPDGLTVFGRHKLLRWLRATYPAARWPDPATWPCPFTPAQQIWLACPEHEAWQDAHPDPFASEAAALKFLEWLTRPESH
ncbi:MAG: hypothetical protein ACREFY_11995, partial [Acetobacteraceae bacterium]